MTHPTATHRFQDNEVADADTAAPNLAAIQDSYEAAKANIVDPAPPWPSAADDDEPFPETELIDGRMVMLPSVPDGSSGTEAMSVAARFLAEQQALEEARPPVTDSEPGPERAAATPGRRGWWRGIRKALHSGDPDTRSES